MLENAQKIVINFYVLQKFNRRWFEYLRLLIVYSRITLFDITKYENGKIINTFLRRAIFHVFKVIIEELCPFTIN